MKTVNELIADVDLRIYMHDAYGKGFMKKCRVSPDAYIQMALQLAYYRDAGKFNLTYEASMTRLFREGRTETVRPCTIESTEWVKSMENKNVSAEERISLLKKACQQHQVSTDFSFHLIITSSAILFCNIGQKSKGRSASIFVFTISFVVATADF